MIRMMDSAQILQGLRQFIGSEHYYRLLPNFIVTEGFKFLMDNAQCYWLGQLYGSHLLSINFDADPFTVLFLNRKGSAASIVIEDGNGTSLAKQSIEYTDFPLESITLYACWDGKNWVGMLPSEY